MYIRLAALICPGVRSETVQSHIYLKLCPVQMSVEAVNIQIKKRVRTWNEI